MTLSTSTEALACPVPLATASSPPWASSRSPGTTALTQVGGSQTRPGAGWAHTSDTPRSVCMAGAGLSLRQWMAMVWGYCFAFFFPLLPPLAKPWDGAGVHLRPVLWSVP